jgi:2-polyprenyl-3-methyl-5-hydroxy-6-metoxy-1,4-benzoquinol methylase
MMSNQMDKPEEMDEPAETKTLEQRVDLMEQQYESLVDYVKKKATFEFVDDATRVLGQKTLNGHHNYNYLGERFRDYELALLNIKQMGYYIGLNEAYRNGGFKRMESVIAPVATRLPSKLCTQDDCNSDWYAFWLKEVRSGFVYHRKLWEFAYIAQSLFAHGALKEGKRGLGFGCGEEPLASLFAKYGASIVATDLDPTTSHEQAGGWIECSKHATSIAKVLNSDVCPDQYKLANISHEFADMNAIPAHFNGQFDFCWSACALEHLGSIELGLEFIENSMDTLKPGGLAVHTTEFNLEDGPTIDNMYTVLYQKSHMEQLRVRLKNLGYAVAPFNFDGGSGMMDGLFDLPPWPWDEAKLGWKMQENFAHLKRSIGGFACTSIAIAVMKPA